MLRYTIKKKQRFVEETAGRIPISDSVDVLIAGGGVAGFSAAIFSRRVGASTLLVEKSGILGGMATGGLMSDFMGINRNITTGIVLELIERLKKTGSVIEAFHSPYDPEVLKYILLEMAEETGVDLLLHTLVVDVIVLDSSIAGVIIESKSGRQAVLANAVVDATGDADIAALAGVPHEKGRKEDGRTQPVSLEFKMDNVDLKSLAKYVKKNPKDFYKEKHITCLQMECKPPLFWALGFMNLIKRAKKCGDLDIDHECMWICSAPREGQVVVNITRATGVDGTDAKQITKAEIETRRQAMTAVNFLKKYVPGFKNSYLMSTGIHIGVRESRRIRGEYILTGKDVLECRKFKDAVARNFCPIDVHGPVGKLSGETWFVLPDNAFYEIPYRCLVPQGVDQLLVAGRCISADHMAHGSTRSMPGCMATGQAAGTAAALAVTKKCPLRKLKVGLLQRRLREEGVIL